MHRSTLAASFRKMAADELVSPSTPATDYLCINRHSCGSIDKHVDVPVGIEGNKEWTSHPLGIADQTVLRIISGFAEIAQVEFYHLSELPESIGPRNSPPKHSRITVRDLIEIDLMLESGLHRIIITMGDNWKGE